MPYPQFDRSMVKLEPLTSRDNKKQIEQDRVAANANPPPLPEPSLRLIESVTNRIRWAREKGRSVVIAFGAHAIKNGLGPVFLHLLERGWLTHLATNGAGVIHDWEFAYQGASCEDVAKMVAQGRFGNWQETGFFINLALNVGAFEGKGYGEAVGALIEHEGCVIPTLEALRGVAAEHFETHPGRAAAATDLAEIVRQFDLTPGWLAVPHPFKRFSVQAGAFRLGIPLTGHPMIGHDIIYNHPMNHCAALGRVAERDFLTFVQSISQIEGGVYISIGSAVMSPMIFEKALSMVQNVAIQQGQHVDNHFILVNDLAASSWDWSSGEPPEDHAAYYLRYNKSFSRMGGEMCYLQADNRAFLLHLVASLERADG